MPVRLAPHQAKMVRSLANNPEQPVKWHAAQLGITEHTCKAYFQDIYKLVGKTGITHLAVWAVINGYRDGCVCIVEGQRERARPVRLDRENAGACH